MFLKLNFYPKIFIYKPIFLFILFFYFFVFYRFQKRSLYSSFKEIEKFIKDNLSGRLYYSNVLFKKRNNPKISIIISTFNGEVYLKPVVRSIQNQKFLDIEIIIVDDGSIDNSVKIILELMKEDRRIILIKNDRNRGTLYTKTRGILNAKGKYILTLDHDNLYANKNVFSRLYNEAEKYNLDLLGFAAIVTLVNIKNLTTNQYLNFLETPIIRKPNISKRFLSLDNKEKSSTFIHLYFIKSDLLFHVIKKLGDKFINRNIDVHDDSILTFLLSRNASTLKHLKDIFYLILIWPHKYSASLIFQKTVKKKERERKHCFSFLTFSEVLLLFTENNEKDKKIAEINFIGYLNNHKKCRIEKNIIKENIRVCNLFLKNNFISKNAKSSISIYLNQTKLIE